MLQMTYYKKPLGGYIYLYIYINIKTGIENQGLSFKMA